MMQTKRNRMGSNRVDPKIIFVVVAALFGTVQGNFIDPDTPKEFHSAKAYTVNDNRDFELVFSDEFEEDGRKFNDGNDPKWVAINKNDYTNAALHYYSHDNAVTSNGVLNITVEKKVNDYRAFDEKEKFWYSDKKYVQSGMVQSWNKFCFIGGIVEFSAKLPGDPQKGGLWPALWMLGNLARATYVGSSDYVWPYSYNKCDSKNQKSQLISACDKVNHYNLAPYTGRGSPEIDILETMQGEPGPLPSTHIQKPYQSTSLQVAPGIEMDRPVLGLRPHPQHWYRHMEYSAANTSDLNPFFYGVTLVHHPNVRTYQSDAISANRQLNTTHYQKQHKYRMEWEPPNSDGEGGYIRWFTDDELIFGLQGMSLNIMQTEIPSEPMYLIMNIAVSHTWGFPTCADSCDCSCYECDNPLCECALPPGYCSNFPSSFEIDYVRVWQAKNDSKHILGCSPEHRPTADFIQGHIHEFTSEGSKRPLQPVAKGGGICTRDTDCGSKAIMGKCSSTGVCLCGEYYTGPNCKASDGYFDFDTSSEKTKFPRLIQMVLPNSLETLLAILIAGFAFSVWTNKQARIRQIRYEKIADINSNINGARRPNPGDRTMITSYQDSASVYALPPETKRDVTYCVIDGRLVDSK